MRLVPARDRGFGFGALRIVKREQRSAVLGADIAALAVELGRIVRGKVDVEQVGETDHRRVESHGNRLGMAGLAAAYFLVSRVGTSPADIAALDRAHPVKAAKHRLGAPETSARQNCLRHCVLHNVVR